MKERVNYWQTAENVWRYAMFIADLIPENDRAIYVDRVVDDSVGDLVLDRKRLENCLVEVARGYFYDLALKVDDLSRQVAKEKAKRKA